MRALQTEHAAMLSAMDHVMNERASLALEMATKCVGRDLAACVASLAAAGWDSAAIDAQRSKNREILDSLYARLSG